MPSARTRSAMWGLLYPAVLFLFPLATGILLVPLYLRKADPALVAGWQATGNTLALLGLLDPGIADIVRVRLARAFGAQQRSHASKIVGTGALLSCIVAVMISGIGLVIAPAMPRLLRMSPIVAQQMQTAILLGLIGTVLQVLSNFSLLSLKLPTANLKLY